MFKKGNKIYSIITGVCPRCHLELMFKYKNPYRLSKALEMHDTCSHCGLKYDIEPNFFYGAMYVSYALSIAFAVAAFIIAYLYFGINPNALFISILITLVVCMPIILRLSRTLWINVFINYDPTVKTKK